MRHWQREHIGVRVDAAPGEHRAPAERERQHEQVDEEQVEREQPRRAAHVIDAHVLDHGDLELARQAEHRAHGEEGHREPPCVTSFGAADVEQRREVGLRARLREKVSRTVEQREGHEQSDGEEGEQLDDGLERDRGHEALVPAADVGVPRAPNKMVNAASASAE